jgi:hypothetical protein
LRLVVCEEVNFVARLDSARRPVRYLLKQLPQSYCYALQLSLALCHETSRKSTAQQREDGCMYALVEDRLQFRDHLFRQDWTKNGQQNILLHRVLSMFTAPTIRTVTRGMCCTEQLQSLMNRKTSAPNTCRQCRRGRKG